MSQSSAGGDLSRLERLEGVRSAAERRLLISTMLSAAAGPNMLEDGAHYAICGRALRFIAASTHLRFPSAKSRICARRGWIGEACWILFNRCRRFARSRLGCGKAA